MNMYSVVVVLGIIIAVLIGITVMAPAKKTLQTYHTKRNFKNTTEPRGHVKKRSSQKTLFMIHKHAASHLHYDLRLEIEGVLASWAVPKGPSTDPAEKRLAVQTEDHPYEYGSFEGVIPAGNYGAGTVMVWDTGIYEDLKAEEGTMSDHLADGRIEIFLKGKKLKGTYALVKTKRTKSGEPYWLLIKMNDAYAHKPKDPVARETRSALTGRTMEEIAQEG